MRKLQGVITANQMKKTVVVRVDRLAKHAKYLKYYRVSKKFKAHDEHNERQVGDIVVIQETRPLSKEKRWKVVSLVRRLPTIEEDIADVIPATCPPKLRRRREAGIQNEQLLDSRSSRE